MKFVNQLLERLHSKPSSRAPNGAAGQTTDITKIIHDSLASAGLGRGTQRGGNIANVIDDALARAGLLGAAPAATPIQNDPVAPASRKLDEEDARSSKPSQASFLSRTFANQAGTLAYKLYVPAKYQSSSDALVPLLVMLHGCTQSPDDFAAGTRMNALADIHGFLVAYPAQSANANGSKCWNWFRPQDQMRGGGEPALIAGMTAQIGTDYRVDATRIYVAGLSAGAAMAVVLGRTHPELFAAVGAHSGLPYRAAHDMGSAFAAMRSGAAGNSRQTMHAAGIVMPTIVFHGDSDHTVAAANGDAIVAEQIRSAGDTEPAQVRASGTAAGGRRYQRTSYQDASGRSIVEDWRVHGAGHAWMGGSASGTYTDPQGPDASAEMVRFFLEHAR
ncbi:MAG: alpha/beta hydrolase family esterase [Thermomonas sp.]